MKTINVGLIGFGTVGSGTAEVLLQQADRLESRTGHKIQLKTVADIVVEELENLGITDPYLVTE